MIRLVALATSSVFVLLSGLHVYWACGGILGASGSVPESDNRPLFKPSRVATLLVAFLLMLAALILFIRSGIGPLSSLLSLSRHGAWALALVFTGRAVGDFRWIGFFKRVRNTRFARLDTQVYSPLCLLIAAGCTLSALGL
jgi:hypothetical protein